MRALLHQARPRGHWQPLILFGTFGFPAVANGLTIAAPPRLLGSGAVGRPDY